MLAPKRKHSSGSQDGSEDAKQLKKLKVQRSQINFELHRDQTEYTLLGPATASETALVSTASNLAGTSAADLPAGEELAPEEACPFFSIPGELRNEIYAICIDVGGISLGLRLRLVSRQVADEVGKALAGKAKATFTLDLSTSGGPQSARWPGSAPNGQFARMLYHPTLIIIGLPNASHQTLFDFVRMFILPSFMDEPIDCESDGGKPFKDLLQWEIPTEPSTDFGSGEEPDAIRGEICMVFDGLRHLAAELRASGFTSDKTIADAVWYFFEGSSVDEYSNELHMKVIECTEEYREAVEKVLKALYGGLYRWLFASHTDK